MTAMEQINQIARDMRAYLSEASSRSEKKFIGVMHPIVPQEVIHAAGLHPFRLFPFPGEQTNMAHAHLHVYTSSIFRAIWDQVLKGQYPFLDGVVLPESCETVTYFARGWRYHRKNDFVATMAGLRFNKTKNALTFFRDDLENLKKELEEFTGRKIFEEALTYAIDVYNRNRELLGNICSLMKQERPPLNGVDLFDVFMVSHVMDKEENNRLLEKLFSEIRDLPAGERPKARLLVSGPCLTDGRIYETIQAAGATVVCDDTNMGLRSLAGQSDSGEDPLLAIARSYANLPCPFSISAEYRMSYLIDLVQEYAVDGVIFAIERACESEVMDFPYLERELRKKGVPVGFVETEYMCDMAPVQTRIEGFIESIMK